MQRRLYKSILVSPNLNQLLQLTALQVRAFIEGVPYEYVLGFNNEFQLSALMSGLKHEIAVGMNDLDQILSYFRSYPEGLREAVRNISLAMEAPIISSFAGVSIGSVPSIVQSLRNELIRMMTDEYSPSFLCALGNSDGGYDADDEWIAFSGEDS